MARKRHPAKRSLRSFGPIGPPLGAVRRMKVVDISIAEHLAVNGIPVPAIAFGIYMEGVTAIIQSGGNGYGYHGSYVEDLPAVLRRALQNNGNMWPPTLKAVQLIGNWAQVHHPGGLYAKAQNLRRLLREAYDRALSEVDFILMPTTPFPAMKHVGSNEVPLSEKLLRGWSALTNCPKTDLTGHPALSMPAAEIDGLPAGVMVVGRSFCDPDVVAFARIYEKAYGWVPTSH